MAYFSNLLRYNHLEKDKIDRPPVRMGGNFGRSILELEEPEGLPHFVACMDCTYVGWYTGFEEFGLCCAKNVKRNRVPFDTRK